MAVDPDVIHVRFAPLDLRPIRYEQVVPASSWLINHDLGRDVSVTVRDIDGVWLLVAHRNVDLDNTVVTFDVPTAGTAYLI